MTTEANKAANFLCSMPSGHTTLRKRDVDSLLMDTGGQLMARGLLYDIRVKHLAVGVYQVRLARWQPASTPPGETR